MFYGYPIKATSENWLHNCLVEMVKKIHSEADKKSPRLKWPECIPKPYSSKLGSRHGLKKRLLAYENMLRQLSISERNQILACLEAQNRIKHLLAGSVNCERLSDLPESAREPIKDLFHFAFGLIKDLGIRDRHYELIYDTTVDHYCPFCCCEPFDAPGGPRFAVDESGQHISEALDHFLPRDEYPFAAANLLNLVPMGGKCNGYKSNTGLLRSKTKQRRRAFYPYSKLNSRICLKGSSPFGGSTKDTPAWKISITPKCPEAATWNEVFSLAARLERDVLNPRYDRWLKDFCKWFAFTFRTQTPTNAQIVSGLKQYHSNEAIKGLNGIEHYRTLVIEMLYYHCRKRTQKLFQRIKSALRESIPPIAP